MNKIYFSKNSNPEDWCGDCGFYYFPFATWFAKRRWGMNILVWYCKFREMFK